MNQTSTCRSSQAGSRSPLRAQVNHSDPNLFAFKAAIFVLDSLTTSFRGQFDMLVFMRVRHQTDFLCVKKVGIECSKGIRKLNQV